MKLRTSWSSALTAAFALAQLPTSFAWGAAGHEIVATIAQVYLHPTTLANVCEILEPGSAASTTFPPCHIAKVATWADRIKREPQYRYTAPLHYVGALGDHPSDACLFPGPRGWAGRRDMNVLGAVRNVTNILVDYTDGQHDVATAEEALKFLVHHVGDMHMPLHLTGRDRGGNSDKVLFDGRVTNLHSLWDSLLIAQALRTVSDNYTYPFPPGSTSVDVESHLRGAIYDSYVRRALYEGMGIGGVPGRFEEASETWLSCPALPAQPDSIMDKLQTVMGLRTTGDEERWDDDVLCPFAWAKEMHRLNCDLVWPPELDDPRFNALQPVEEAPVNDFFTAPRPRPHPELLELDTPQYAGRIRKEWVVEKQMIMAGVRLAGILNGLFMDVDALVDGCTDLPLVFV